MKILFISHSQYLNGAETALLTLLSNLDRSRFQPVLVLPHDGELGERARCLSVPTYVTDLEWWIEGPDPIMGEIPLRARVLNLLKIVEKENPDLIHTNTSVIIEGAIAAAIKGIPHVWHIHEILNNHPGLRPLLPFSLTLDIIGKLSDKTVVVSNAVKDSFNNLIPDNKVQIAYNGIDLHKFRPGIPSSFRLELGIPEDKPVILAVGSIIKEKGYDNLLQAVALLKHRRLEATTVIVGHGGTERVQELVTQIHTLGLDQDVKYVNYRTDIPQIIASANVFVLSSITDAFPYVVLEAMAMGKPVVATNCGGPAEMIISGQSGYIVDVNAPDQLAAKIEFLLSHTDEMFNIGNAARLAIQSRFSVDSFVSTFTQIYENLAFSSKTELVGPKQEMLVELLAVYDSIVLAKVLQKLPQEIEDKNNYIQQLHLEVQQLKEEIKNKQIDIDVSKKTIQDLLNSFSWRITSPIRKFAALIFNK